MPIPFQIIWSDESGNELKGPDIPNGLVWLPVGFPGTTSSIQSLQIRSNAQELQTFEILSNVKFFLTGNPTDVDIIQNIWPNYGDETKPELNGGFEISFDFGRTYIRFNSFVGVESNPDTWVLLPVTAVGSQGVNGILGAFDIARISVRYVIPPGVTQFQPFNASLGIDFDII